MGLDVLLGANNQDELDAGAYDLKGYDLSRDFCDLIGQHYMEDIESPLLDQIGVIAGVDISPLYEMSDYLHPEDVESLLGYDSNKDAKAKTIKAAEESRVAVAHNIERVYATVSALLVSLATVPDLFSRLVPDDYGMFDYDFYFSDFLLDKSEETGGNNLGED